MTIKSYKVTMIKKKLATVKTVSFGKPFYKRLKLIVVFGNIHTDKAVVS